MFAFFFLFAFLTPAAVYSQELSTQTDSYELLDKGSYSQQEGFFTDLRELLLRCAVQPFAISRSGHRVAGNLQSECRELQIFKNAAKIEMNGQIYIAHLSDAEFSDEGDLNNISIATPNGTAFAYRTNVLAYGDVILALAGGNDDFREVYDEKLLSESLK